MKNGLNEEIETHETQSIEGQRRNRRFGIQVPLYKKDPGKASTRLSRDEYHDVVERRRKYLEEFGQRLITPKNVVIGIIMLLFDLTILQVAPYFFKMIEIPDQVLVGEWLVGLAGVITVATFIYIFTSGR